MFFCCVKILLTNIKNIDQQFDFITHLSFMEQKHGILLLNKPKGMSSAFAVGRLKKLGQKKIGHAGTLDPMATGLLIVLLGEATKLSGYLLENGEKTYSGTLELGKITDTWDAEGKIVQENDYSFITEEMLANAVKNWLGKSIQEVPPYSAAKHNGQALYKLARAGKEVPVKTKEIYISHAEIQWVDLPCMRFRVTCSSGSYIRSLAHSLGIRLGSGATLTELTREHSHPFYLQDAVTLEELQKKPEILNEKLIPMENALPNWRTIELSEREAKAVKNGNPVQTADTDFTENERVFLRYQGNVLALAEGKVIDSRNFWQILRGLATL